MNLQESLRGSGALLGHGLNQLARSMESHLMVLLFAIPPLLGILSCSSVHNALIPAPGLIVFKTLVYGDAVCLVLLGVPYFAAAIAEEREQGMLGLLKLSGISPVGLMLGKSTVRLVPTALGLILQIPLITLAVTLGGVTYSQIGAAFCALLAFLLLLANLSLRMSMNAPTTAEAVAKTWGMLILVVLLPQLLVLPSALCPLGSHWWQNSGVLATGAVAIRQWIEGRQIYSRLITITESSFDESWLSSQVLIYLAVSFWIFSRCWRYFEPLTQEKEPDIGNRPEKEKTTKTIRAQSVPCWDDALAWKEFQYGSGGWSHLRATIVTFVLLFVVFFAIFWRILDSKPDFPHKSSFQTFCILLQEFGPVFILIGVTGCIAVFFISCVKAFHLELHEKTYSTLMLIPQAADRILFSTLKGRMMEAIPFAGLFALGCLWTLVTNNWMTRISIEGFHTWLGLLLIPCCCLAMLGDVGIVAFYLGLWRNSTLWNLICGVLGTAMFYLEMGTLFGVAALLSQQNPLLACALTLARLTASFLLWKYWWRRLPVLMHDRMRD